MPTPITRVIHSSRNQMTLPDNSGYTFMFDTTNWTKSINGTLGKSAAISSPGGDRLKGSGKEIHFSVGCTGQDVTLYRACLNGVGAWETHATTTITAGATAQKVAWGPITSDWIVYVVAGGTAPTALYNELTVLET